MLADRRGKMGDGAAIRCGRVGAEEGSCMVLGELVSSSQREHSP